MTFPPDSLLPVALAAALLTSLLCMHAAAQQPVDGAARDLLAKVDGKRVPAAKADTATLVVEGDYTITFEQNGKQEVAARGSFREIYLGNDLARHTSDLGEFGKMEKGVHRNVAWEVDPTMGAKVHRGAHDAVVRRYFAWLRGARVGALYASAARTGTETIGGRECTVLKLTPEVGAADVAYVDADGMVQRIDMALPTPESADATFELGDEMLAQITFAEWTDVDGVSLPKRRSLRMGPATVSFVCKELNAGTRLEAASFAPPPAVEKARNAAPTEPAIGADGKPTYQVVQREAQPVASIRVKCKPAEISQQLATLLPEVWAHVTATGGKVAGAPFSRYHSMTDTEVDLEAGIPVQQPIAEKGRVKNAELPAGRALTAWHIGAYDGLGAAHEGLRRQLAAQKYTPRGAVWEIYWTDPGMVPDQAKWRTQLFQPIE